MTAREYSAEEMGRLDAAIHLLEDRQLAFSARAGTGRGRICALLALVGAVVGVVLAPIGTLHVLLGIVLVLYIAALGYRARLVSHQRDSKNVMSVSDDEARLVPTHELPMYTVLVPAYKEPESIPQLLKALAGLEYPVEKLDVQLLLEGDDTATVEAATALCPEHITVVLVPPCEPRTKPKALNYGLLQCKGELVTIFDAEDVPDPLQLRRAAVAFSHDPGLAVVQARLSFYNRRQNLLTKWFTLDYAIWFEWFLPSLLTHGGVIPLGGTSNHFRKDVLLEVGGWDPFNVTEDADLGIRLMRMGKRISLLDSTTLEEATSDTLNWVKQRSRWYKGYLQTWLVHMRQGWSLHKKLGRRAAVSFHFFIGGTPILAACNAVMWGLSLMWLIVRPEWLSSLFPSVLYYPALASLIFGNFLCVYTGMVSARESGNGDMMLAAALMPVYWGLMSLAATKALVQLVVHPSYWEKTTHGMHLGSGGGS